MNHNDYTESAADSPVQRVAKQAQPAQGDTPRTDHASQISYDPKVSLGHVIEESQKLERENADLRQQLSDNRRELDQQIQMRILAMKEREQLRKELEEYRAQIINAECKIANLKNANTVAEDLGFRLDADAAMHDLVGELKAQRDEANAELERLRKEVKSRSAIV